MANPIRQREGALREDVHIWGQFYGLDLKDAPLLTPPRFARRANFVDISLLGSVAKSKAPTKINAAQITDNPKIYGMHEYRQTDGDKFFIVYTNDGKLYKVDTSGVVTALDLQSLSLAADRQVTFTTFNNLAIIGDGINVPIYMYRNVLEAAASVTVLKDIYELGNDAPLSNPGVATGAAGAISGQYYYKVTFVSDTGNESNPKQGAGAGPVGPSSQRVELTAIPTNTDDQRNVVARRIYRTDDSTGISEANAIYYFLTEIADNTTTTYSDNALDETLGDRIVETYDPPVAGLMGFTEYNGSLYAFVKNSHDLRYTDINNGEAWSPFAVEPIAPGDGDNLTGLGQLNSLVVFKDRSIHLWQGFPGLFQRTRKAKGIGCVSHNSIQNVDLPSGGDVLFFLSQWGPYFFDEQDPYPIGREIEPIFTKKDPLYQINHSAMDKADATYIFDEKKYVLSIPVNGSADNNMLLIYDVYSKSWHVREPFYCGAITTRKDSANQEVIVGGESRSDVTNGGFIFTLEGDDQYLGGDYKGEYITAWNHLGTPNNKKFAKYIEVDVVSQANMPLFIDIYIDGSDISAQTLTVNLDTGGDVWDTGVWDTAIFASDEFITAINGVRQIKFRHISLGFRTEEKDAPWEILQARLRYTLLPPAGTKI